MIVSVLGEAPICLEPRCRSGTGMDPVLETQASRPDLHYAGSLFSWLSDDWSLVMPILAQDECELSLTSTHPLWTHFLRLREHCSPPTDPSSPLTAQRPPESLFDIYSRIPRKDMYGLTRHRQSDPPLSLPADIAREVMLFLCASDLHALSCSHSYFRDLAVGVIPGLKLHLFPHQYTSGITLFILCSV